MRKAVDVIASISLILFIVFLGMSHAGWPPKVIIHKTMNHNSYSIVIISRAGFTRMTSDRELYVDVWQNHKKINSYHIASIDAIDDYDERIKDITILPQENMIKVEFIDVGRSKSRTGVDLYKIAYG